MTPRHVYRRTIAGDLVSSPEDLHQAVGVLRPGDALKPRVRNLLPILAYLRLHLAYCLLQRHGRPDLQKAQLQLEPGELGLRSHHVEFAGRHLDLLHGVEEHSNALDVCRLCRSPAQYHGLLQLQTSDLVLVSLSRP